MSGKGLLWAILSIIWILGWVGILVWKGQMPRVEVWAIVTAIIMGPPAVLGALLFWVPRYIPISFKAKWCIHAYATTAIWAILLILGNRDLLDWHGMRGGEAWFAVYIGGTVIIWIVAAVFLRQLPFYRDEG